MAIYGGVGNNMTSRYISRGEDYVSPFGMDRDNYYRPKNPDRYYEPEFVDRMIDKSQELKRQSEEIDKDVTRLKADNKAKDDYIKSLKSEKESLEERIERLSAKDEPKLNHCDDAKKLNNYTKSDLVAEILRLRNTQPPGNTGLIQKLDNIIENNNNEKAEELDMKFNNMFGDFGQVNSGELALTMNGGIAVKRSEDEYVRYNAETQQIENQMDLVISDANDFIFIMPSMEIAVGDVVKYKKSYCQVLSVAKNGALKVVDIGTGTKKTILKEINLFGMGFWSKVTCLFNMQGNFNQAMNPMMMALMMSDKEGSKDNDMMKNMMMMSAMQGMGGNMMGGMNPMMIMMMSGKGDSKGMDMKDIMMMQMMSGGMMNMFGQQPQQPVKTPVIPAIDEVEDKEDDSKDE